MSDWPNTMDAGKWAKAWMEHIAKNRQIPYDEGTMISWFANAIMAGFDEAGRRNDDHWTDLENRLRERIGRNKQRHADLLNQGRVAKAKEMDYRRRESVWALEQLREVRGE